SAACLTAMGLSQDDIETALHQATKVRETDFDLQARGAAGPDLPEWHRLQPIEEHRIEESVDAVGSHHLNSTLWASRQRPRTLCRRVAVHRTTHHRAERHRT